jgi:hypothetical protein
MNTPKIAGSTLVIASIMLIVGSVLHPMPKEAGTEALARSMVESLDGLWYPVHVIALLAFPMLMFGFLILYRIAAGRGEQTYSLPAIFSLGLATVFAILGVVMEGFVEPILAQRFLAPNASEVTVAILEYNILFDLSIDSVTFFLLIMSPGLFGASLIRAGLINKWFARSGMAISLIGLLSYIAAVMGPYPYLVLTLAKGPYELIFELILFLIIGWSLVLGILLSRMKIEEEQAPMVSTEIATAGVKT